jgi:nucleoside phosphorylase
MKIALFAAVPDEVSTLADKVNFTGIGRENATRAMIKFMEKHKEEDFTMLNIGSVGSHDKPVGSILSIREVISAGASFYPEKMLPVQFALQSDKDVQPATLYSSDAFVSLEVFTGAYMDSVKQKADCFDMESSVLVSFAQEYGKKYVSYKIVSDNLDVDIEVWRQRVQSLSKVLVAHIQNVLDELGQNEKIEFLK